MTILAWLREPEKRAQLPAWLLLAAASAWGLFRLARSLQILFGVSNDLYTYYSLWFVLGQRDCADIALQHALYLPHTWLALTPLFLLGWPLARFVMLGVDVAAVFYIWHRLSQLTGLKGLRSWLLLAFFWSCLSTTLVVGLGNLALVCVAAVLAAFPFSSPGKGVWLTLSAMKQTMVFPVYFLLLLKRPKALLVPVLVIGAAGLATLWWARLGPLDVVKLARESTASVSTWTQYDATGLRRVVGLFVKNPPVVSGLTWGLWFVLFGVAARCMREPLLQLAALLLLALLPIYHNTYDLVMAAPVLAIFLSRLPLIWPALATLCLAGEWGSLYKLAPAGPLRNLGEALGHAYYPLLVLALFGALVWLDRRRPVLAPQPESAVSSAAVLNSREPAEKG